MDIKTLFKLSGTCLAALIFIASPLNAQNKPIQELEATYETAHQTNDYYQMGLAKYKMATIYFKEKQMATAHKYASETIGLWNQADTIDYYNTYRLHRDMAAMLASVSRFSEAISHLGTSRKYITEHLERFPEAAKKHNDHLIPDEITYFEGLYLRENGLMGNAARKLLPLTTAEFIMERPDLYAQAKNQIGLAQYHLGKYSEAETTFKEILKIDGLKPQDNAHYHHNLANALAEQGEYTAAITEMEYSAQLNLEANRTRALVVNYIDMADLYLKTDEPANAIAMTNKVLAIDYDLNSSLDLFRVHLLRERANYRLGNENEAIADGDTYEEILMAFNQQVKEVLIREQSLQFDIELAESIRVTALATEHSRYVRSLIIYGAIAMLLFVFTVYLFRRTFKNHSQKLKNGLMI
tara:strand:- start:15179 stop:16411 length:1233 start_codon:yes stop_codon:yes gene_type:complete